MANSLEYIKINPDDPEKDRTLERFDASQLTGFFGRKIKNCIEDATSHPDGFAVLAVQEGNQLIAATTGVINPEGDSAELWWTVVAEEHQKQGIGGNLRKKLAELLLREGVKTLKTTAGSSSGEKLIQSQGSTHMGGRDYTQRL